MLADSTKNSGSTIFCRVKLLIEYYMFFTAANADSLFAFTALWAKALFCCSKSLGFCKISFKQLLYCRKDTPWCFAVCKTILQGVQTKMSTLQDFLWNSSHHFSSLLWDLYFGTAVQSHVIFALWYIELLVTSLLTSNSCAEDESSSGGLFK